MDVALLIWVIALTILVIVGVVWVLDLQTRMRRLQSRLDKVFSGEIEDDANVTMALS